jgi:hypothetical protein
MNLSSTVVLKLMVDPLQLQPGGFEQGWLKLWDVIITPQADVNYKGCAGQAVNTVI